MKRTNWIILDFVLAAVVAVLGNIVASYLESQFQLANTDHFVFVGLLFLFSLGLLLFITLKRFRNETAVLTTRASKTTVKVEQRVEEVEGELLGVEVDEIPQGNIQIDQTVGNVSKDGKTVGLKSAKTSGQNIRINQNGKGGNKGKTIGVMINRLSNSTIKIFNVPLPSATILLFLAFMSLTIVVILVSIGVRVNVNVLPTPTKQFFPLAKENESLVIIVPFAGNLKNYSVYPERYIRDAIQDRVSRLNSIGQLTRLEIYPTPLDSQREIRQVGETYKATLVIWGEFDDIGGMRIFVEILSNIPKQDSQQSSNWTPLITLPINESEVSNISRECIVEGMPAQADYLTVMSFGMLDLIQGKRKEAEGLFTQAIDAIQSVDSCKSRSDQAYYWRGLAQSLQENYSSALADLNEALVLNPKNRLALAQRGEVLLTIGRATESELDLRSAIDLFYPEEKESRSVLYDNLGVALMLQGKYDEATKFLNQARQNIGENNDELMIALNLAHLGSLDQMKGQFEEAFDNYNQALTICQKIQSGPCESTLLGNIGSIFQTKGDLETALQFYYKALAIANQSQFIPGQVTQIIKIGNVCLEKRDLNCARENYSNALIIAKKVGLLYNQAQAQIGLALVEEQMGNKNMALEKLQAALQILENIGSSDTEAVRDQLQRIQQAPTPGN